MCGPGPCGGWAGSVSLCLVGLDECGQCGQGQSMSVSVSGLCRCVVQDDGGPCQCGLCQCMVCGSVDCSRVLCGSMCVVCACVMFVGYDSMWGGLCVVYVFMCIDMSMCVVCVCLCQCSVCLQGYTCVCVCYVFCAWCLCVSICGVCGTCV